MVVMSVQFSTTWITAAIRERKFFQFAEVKEAVAEGLKVIDATPFQKRTGSLRESYFSEEKVFYAFFAACLYESAA